MSGQEMLAKTYDPKAVEEKWYEFWEEKGYFKPEYRTDGPTFCVTIPPPNVTGELHIGHALQHAIHDAIIRWNACGRTARSSRRARPLPRGS